MSEPLPEILPADPLPLLAQWLEEARPAMKAPTAMALATVDANGRPTVRMVICRGFDVRLGWLVFYSDRESTKGVALAANPRAALVFHWDVFERQIRVEGPVTHAPESDSDRYWSTPDPAWRLPPSWNMWDFGGNRRENLVGKWEWDRIAPKRAPGSRLAAVRSPLA